LAVESEATNWKPNLAPSPMETSKRREKFSLDKAKRNTERVIE